MRYLRALVLCVLMLPTAPVPLAAQAPQQCFDTGYCLSDRFLSFWEQNGGAPVFGWPIGPVTPGTPPAQWLQRYRFEHHPGNTTPYDVLLARLGVIGLEQSQRDWTAAPPSPRLPGCLYFEQTRKNVCNHVPGSGFRVYWETHGLLDPALDPYRRSLALFGLPLTEPTMETNTSGDTVLTQWFERARLEWHPNNPDPYKVLLGLLGDELRPLVETPAPLPVPAGQNARVMRVIDGDTITVLIGDAEMTLRLIGVDTPETVAPNQPVGCYGPEASAFTRAALTGKQVILEQDVSETDRFGRLLRYVWLDGQLFNETLVREGYAQVSTFPPDVRYVDRLRAAQVAAREANKGRWGACQATTPLPAATPAPGGSAPPAGRDCPSTHPIKGNINSQGEKIYHVPGGQFYTVTIPEVCFRTEADAQAAGYRRSQR